jgi:predicted transcriptional regulator
MKLENDLSELHTKGQLCEKGLLKETYSEESNELEHQLTDEGKAQIREILKDRHYQKEFMKMALEEAQNDPKIARELIISAIKRIQ